MLVLFIPCMILGRLSDNQNYRHWQWLGDCQQALAQCFFVSPDGTFVRLRVFLPEYCCLLTKLPVCSCPS